MKRVKDDAFDVLKNFDMGAGPMARKSAEALSQGCMGQLRADSQLVDGARQFLQARQELAKLVPKSLFRDSAWDMMLELFISAAEGKDVYVKQLMIASGESSAAAMRRIDRLEEAAFIKRIADSLDHRRVIVALTERGCGAMLAMLRHLFASSPPGSVSVKPLHKQPENL